MMRLSDNGPRGAGVLTADFGAGGADIAFLMSASDVRTCATGVVAYMPNCGMHAPPSGVLTADFGAEDTARYSQRVSPYSVTLLSYPYPRATQSAGCRRHCQ